MFPTKSHSPHHHAPLARLTAFSGAKDLAAGHPPPLCASVRMHYASSPARRLARKCTSKFLARPPTADSPNGIAPAVTAPASATALCAVARARNRRSPSRRFPIFGSSSALRPISAPSLLGLSSSPPLKTLAALRLQASFFPRRKLTP